MILTELSKDSKKLESSAKAHYATVIAVTSQGVKIRIDGEEEALETYYNSLQSVNAGNRVYIEYVSGTVLIIGSLKH